MTCSQPLYIKNRRYSTHAEDYNISQQFLHPEDIFRKTLIVPCGRCKACLHNLRNDWFVRMNREVAYCRSLNIPTHFLTITINPINYDSALENPSDFIRSFFESIRSRFGSSLKHIVFQEFGEKGRLHFHALIHGFSGKYADLRAAVSRYGFVWIRPVKPTDPGYISKYITKAFDSSDPRYLQKRYRRRFVSAHYGDYLGEMPAPTAFISVWRFIDTNSGIAYNYRIPRYYNRYLSEEDADRRSVLSALVNAAYLGFLDKASLISERVRELFSVSVSALLRDIRTKKRIAAFIERFVCYTVPKTSPPITLGLSPDISNF